MHLVSLRDSIQFPQFKRSLGEIGCYKISNLELKDPISVGLSITLKTFKFITLFVALVGTIDAGVTIGGFKGSGPNAQTGEIKEKLLTHKTYCNN